MRSSASVLSFVLALSVIGCAGPSNKLGRGMANVTEIARMGEIRRSIEQTALWDGVDAGYTTGFVRGMNRTLVRTGIGVYEIVTFPIPPYGPLLTSTNRIYPDVTVRNNSFPWGGMVLTEQPIYPASYKPGRISDGIFDTDTFLGFSGGDWMPFVPGSRFIIFEN